MDEFWKMFFAFSWVWIPVIAILVGGFTEWLKFKARQQELGATTKETEKKLEELTARYEARQKALVERIQNLEAIVTSQAWDVLHDPAASAGDRERRLAALALELEPPEEDEDPDTQKAARLAKRLRR